MTFPGPRTGDIKYLSGSQKLPSFVSPSWFIPRLKSQGFILALKSLSTVDVKVSKIKNGILVTVIFNFNRFAGSGIWAQPCGVLNIDCHRHIKPFSKVQSRLVGTYCYYPLHHYDLRLCWKSWSIESCHLVRASTFSSFVSYGKINWWPLGPKNWAKQPF